MPSSPWGGFPTVSPRLGVPEPTWGLQLPCVLFVTLFLTKSACDHSPRPLGKGADGREQRRLDPRHVPPQ